MEKDLNVTSLRENGLKKITLASWVRQYLPVWHHKAM